MRFSFLCWLVGVFCLMVGFVFCLGLLFWFCFWFRIVSFPSLRYLSGFPPGTGRAMPTQHPLHRKRANLNDPRVVHTQHRVSENKAGQGVLLVTEPFSELNAGLIVIFGSSHPPLFEWDDWTRRCRRLPDEQLDEIVSAQAVQLEDLFFARLGEFLTRTLGESEVSSPQWKSSTGSSLGWRYRP